MPDKIAGFLEVGINSSGEIVINGDKNATDSDGRWHIVFSESQALRLTELLLIKVREARLLRS